MPTFDNGEVGASIRQKINEAILKVDGDLQLTNIDVSNSAINDTIVGQLIPSSGYFTTIDVSDQITTVNITVTGLVNGRDISQDGSKLDTIETGAQVNPNALDIKNLYESNSNTNEFTDNEKSKLSTVEQGAQVNPNPSQIKTFYESNLNTNAFTDDEKNKLVTIETGAQVNPSAEVIKNLYEGNADTNAFTDTEKNKLLQIEQQADVTDAENVAEAGALMVSELTSEQDVKSLNQGVSTADTPTFAGVNANASSATVWENPITISIGSSDKSVDGSTDVSWSIEEIGAVSITQTNGSAEIPSGGELERDALPNAGYLRFNSDANRFEGYNGSSWNFIDNPIREGEAGEISCFARDTPPDGWLRANGAEVSRTVYSELFQAIGVTYGSGDGSTTFNLPDLRGEFIRGWDDGRGIDSGRQFGSFQNDEIREHTHVLFGNNRGTFSGQLSAPGLFVDDAENPAEDPETIQSTGGVETRPRNIALLYCIRY